MLTLEEKKFIDYWEHNRDRKKKVLKQLYIGLPFGVLMVTAISVNFFSGWDKRAAMVANEEINNHASLILVLLVAVLMIVTFIVIFSARHSWDMNEQRYKELLSRSDKDTW